MHLCGLFTRQLPHPPYNIHSSDRHIPFSLYYSFPACFLGNLPAFLSSFVTLVFSSLPFCSYSLSYFPPLIPSVFLLLLLLLLPSPMLLHYFPVKSLSNVSSCSMLGIDCTLEFVLKAQHRPDNLSLFFSLSGSGERLKLSNRK